LESLKNNNVFLDVQKLGDGKYPAKQEVNPLSCLVLYSLRLTSQRPPFFLTQILTLYMLTTL
jgi:hypothetical protein